MFFWDKKTYQIAGSIFIIILSFALALVSKPVHFIDDAWITFRVADNFANNGELVFNLGDKVEAITNGLWAITLGALSRIFSVHVEVVAAYLSLILIGYVLYRIWSIGLLFKINPIVATLPAVVLILSPDFYGAMTNGLETPLFTLLLAEAVYWFIKKKYQVTFVALGLLFMTRPETIAFGFLLWVILLLSVSKKEYIFSITVSFCIFLSLVFLSTIFRVWYYGDIIPNSVRAKLIPVQPWIILEGVRYAIDFMRNNSYLLFFFAIALLSVIMDLRKSNISKFDSFFPISPSNQLLLFCIAVVLFSFIVSIKNGGDWMPYYRLLSQYGIIYSILFILTLDKKNINLITAISILMVPILQTSSQALYRIHQERKITFIDYSADMGFWQEAVNKLTPTLTSSDVVSAEAIGYISYKLRGIYIHDPLGLADKYIAKNGKPAIPYGKLDIQYTIYSIQPSVMIWHYASHLKSADAGYLDKNYIIYCYANCDNWTANIIMLRRDRADKLSPKFNDWRTITMNSLQATSP